MESSDLPFNKELGIQLADETVTLQPGFRHGNHLGTIHATVAYGLAEAASGHFLLRQLAERAELFAVLRGSTVKDREPGDLEEPIVAQGSATEEGLEKMWQQLGDRNRAMVEITVSVTQQNRRLLTGTFTWFISAQ